MKQRQKSLKATGFDELKKSLSLGNRRVHRNRITSSGYVAVSVILPKLWVDTNRIKAGDKVELTMETNGTLSMRKAGQEAVA